MTETRTGPLGCSNYDNLDSVSSVLVQSPENKVQLQGLSAFNGLVQLFTALFIVLLYGRKEQKKLFNQVISSASAFVPLNFQHSPGLRTALNPPAFIGLQLILPVYLREGFVQAALSYIACNGEGDFDCKDNDCWCQCEAKFPQCNCPYMDIQAMEESLQRIAETWGVLYKDFEESGTALSRKIIHILFVLHSSLRSGNYF